MMVRNSAALLDALENNVDMVKALFAESRVESTKEANADDVTAGLKPLITMIPMIQPLLTQFLEIQLPIRRLTI